MLEQKLKIILLPGLNGTVGLFQEFINHCPPEFDAFPFSYPTGEKLSYQALTDLLVNKLDNISGPMVLLGESFSGPLSLFTAQAFPDKVIAVVLVASFVSPPRHKCLKLLPWEFVFALTKPLYMLRGKLANCPKESRIIDTIGIEVRKVKPAVLAYRIRQTLSVDARNALINCRCPILYLQAEKDIIVPKSALDKILKLKKTVQVATLPGHHFFLQSMPEEAWQAIVKFLKSTEINPESSH